MQCRAIAEPWEKPSTPTEVKPDWASSQLITSWATVSIWSMVSEASSGNQP